MRRLDRHHRAEGHLVARETAATCACSPGSMDKSAVLPSLRSATVTPSSTRWRSGSSPGKVRPCEGRGRRGGRRRCSFVPGRGSRLAAFGGAGGRRLPGPRGTRSAAPARATPSATCSGRPARGAHRRRTYGAPDRRVKERIRVLSFRQRSRSSYAVTMEDERTTNPNKTVVTVITKSAQARDGDVARGVPRHHLRRRPRATGATRRGAHRHRALIQVRRAARPGERVAQPRAHRPPAQPLRHRATSARRTAPTSTTSWSTRSCCATATRSRSAGPSSSSSSAGTWKRSTTRRSTG